MKETRTSIGGLAPFVHELVVSASMRAAELARVGRAGCGFLGRDRTLRRQGRDVYRKMTAAERGGLSFRGWWKMATGEAAV